MKWSKSLFPLLLLVAAELLFISGLWEFNSLKGVDTLFELRGPKPAPDSLIIVDIDDASFAELDISWPFPRQLHANLINNLKAAGAKQIIFDVEFTEHSDRLNDSLLAVAVKNAGNVVLAGKLINQQGGGWQTHKLVKPLPMLAGSPWGLVNMRPDRDDVVHRYPVVHAWDDKAFPGLSVQAYLQAKGLTIQNITITRWVTKVGNLQIPMAGQGYSLINYYGPTGSIKHVSYADFISPEYKKNGDFFDLEPSKTKGQVAGKMVFVGASAAELHDVFLTPFGPMPGVEVQAQFTANLLQNSLMADVNWLWRLLAEVLLAVVCWHLFTRVKPGYSVGLAIVIMGSSFYMAYYLLAYQRLLFPPFNLAFICILFWVVALGRHYYTSVKERRFIKSAFSHYMAPDLVEELLKDPASLQYGGTSRQVSVLFSDIRSFTNYTEAHEPDYTVGVLREYLTAMVDCVMSNRGSLDKFVGDMVVALFGAPVQSPNHALSACQAALAMRAALGRLQAEWKERGIDILESGIGINTGEATVGNLGSEQIFDYTAIGDTINLGARLESLTKQYKPASGIIISHYTYQQVKGQVIAEYIDEVQVKGRNKPVKIYELKGLVEPAPVTIT